MIFGDKMKKTYLTNSRDETIFLGEKLGKILNSGDVVLLMGDLSAGKTTFAKGIGIALKINKTINSPTFNIAKVYHGDKTMYHLDLYRLHGINNDFDLWEYVEGDGIAVIEWPEQVSELIPDDYIKVTIEITGLDSRSITIESVGNKYDDVIKRLELWKQ